MKLTPEELELLNNVDKTKKNINNLIETSKNCKIITGVKDD